jgi:thiol:disulfide interchange protein DsbD
MALIGGLILNIMPCVLPVLTLKLYGLVEQADSSDQEKRRAGLAYTAGILASFWALAASVWAARTAFGVDVSWGFQFQYPGYVAALATVVWLFGLNLFGVFELPSVGASQADELAGREGPVGYFFNGVFATLVATPCSAPFLGSATAFAFSQPTWALVLIFTAIGLGLALPFLLVAFVPAAYRLLPQPGAWMESFKQLLGFTLVGTAVWLVDVLGAEIGADRLTGFLVFLVFASLGAWIFGRWGGPAETSSRKLASLAAGVAVAGIGGWSWLDLQLAEAATCDDGAVSADVQLDYASHIPWQAFHDKRVEALAGRTLFLDFTADWCVSCKVNEKTILETQRVRDVFAKHKVVPLQADFTRQDPQIKAWLDRYHRAGVPMYLVVPPSGVADAILLPEVITPDMVSDAIEAAAKKG